MDQSLEHRPRFLRGQATAVFAVAMLLGSTSLADTPVEAFSTGNFHKGEMHFPMYRGGSQQPEVTVPALPGNCGRHVDATVKWNEEQDKVTVRLRGKGVLDPHPTITR